MSNEKVGWRVLNTFSFSIWHLMFFIYCSLQITQSLFFVSLLIMSIAVEESEKLLSRMSRAEKAEILQWIIQDLSDAFPGIENRPEVAGGVACIVQTRIPVWLLEQARRFGTSEAELLRAYPVLRAGDLTNAWAYVRTHRDEIERQISENEEA